jgi:hypothetical protein
VGIYQLMENAKAKWLLDTSIYCTRFEAIYTNPLIGDVRGHILVVPKKSKNICSEQISQVTATSLFATYLVTLPYGIKCSGQAASFLKERSIRTPLMTPQKIDRFFDIAERLLIRALLFIILALGAWDLIHALIRK